MEELIDGSFYYIPETQALVELTGQKNDILYGSTYQQYTPGKSSANHVHWGVDNLAPQKMLRLCAENPIKMSLIKTSRNLVLGNRLMVQKRIKTKSDKGENVFVFEPLDMPQIEDYLEALEVNKYMKKAGFNLEFAGNVFTNLSIDGKKSVTGLGCFDATEARCEIVNPKNGRIENYHINPNWENYRVQDTVIVPTYDKLNPSKSRESILHGRDWTPGQTYYDHPSWWGTKTWTEVANKVAIFHDKGLSNGYTIKYHIKVPAKYFERGGDEAAMNLAKKKFKEDINKFLANQSVQEKTFVSTFNVDQETGRVLPGIEIIPVNVQMSDDAYTKLLESANMMQSAGHNLPPQISHLSFGGKFGASGSEIRSALQVHLAIHSSVSREILLEPLYQIKKVMNWDRDIFFGFEDKIVTTLDDSKSGTKTQNSNQNAA